jgi:uncharacterized membrane-anchored protein YitT (DUF2179 family)
MSQHLLRPPTLLVVLQSPSLHYLSSNDARHLRVYGVSSSDVVLPAFVYGVPPMRCGASAISFVYAVSSSMGGIGAISAYRVQWWHLSPSSPCFWFDATIILRDRGHLRLALRSLEATPDLGLEI